MSGWPWFVITVGLVAALGGVVVGYVAAALVRHRRAWHLLVRLDAEDTRGTPPGMSTPARTPPEGDTPV